MDVGLEVGNESLSTLLAIRSFSVANICDITAKLQGRISLQYESFCQYPSVSLI
jgi:hypothetical protein